MDLYYILESPHCRSVIMVAKALEIELNRKLMNLKKKEHYSPEFLKINPQHTIPTLVDDGFVIWEARVILIYLAEKYDKNDKLYPKCPQKRAAINQKLFFDLNMYSLFADYYYPIVRDKKAPEPDRLAKFKTRLEFLDLFLKGQTYAANNTLSIADFSLLASISTFDAVGIGLGKYPHLLKWYNHCKRTLPGAEENKEGCELFKKYW
ncbi:glutathione S-transferase 2-like [Anastrepha ludens]|uniref:glutathione S-transferase 2-like n=1 Tax=Anastrepha ludens TaxID=28586 RepID=UPI0023AF1A5E|nr:glutathione S-transferase 2-like [Anastrepha ludens]